VSFNDDKNSRAMRYLIVLTAGARRLSDTTFAVESAFAQHLRDLREVLRPRFDEIVVAMPELSDETYERQKNALSVIDEEKERITYRRIYAHGASRKKFWKEFPKTFSTIVDCVRDADFIHSHLSYDLYRPVELCASVVGKLMKKKVISITDMDNRRDADMNLKNGIWSLREYLTCKAVYDPIRDLQQRAYVRMLDMVLFKEPQQVEDYGRGAPHVRLFLDPNFAADMILDDKRVDEKCAALNDPTVPLKLLYFGRFVPYKGVEEMVESFKLARERGANVELTMFGDGPLRERLERLAQGSVRFVSPKPYGPEFFELLYAQHMSLACPKSADTPRSAWDSMASGLPILAYDTPFYSGLAKLTNAVDVTPWVDVEKFADRICEIAKDKTVLAPMIRNAVRAAEDNTQHKWLKRRADWVEELFAPNVARASAPALGR
jgi:glycosyltransferase involved in cell wall biosynthesis